MNEVEQVTQAVFGDTPIRAGYSTAVGMSFVVAADLKGAMKYNSGVNSFLRGLEKQQEVAGQSKGSDNVTPLYVGLETVRTAGGPQQMKVVYKRGVFQLLMLSRKPEATEYRDRIFDVLEQIERDGYYINPDITKEQLEAAEEQIEDLKMELELHEISASGEEARKNKEFLSGVRAGRNNPDIDYEAIHTGKFVPLQQDFS